MNDHATPFYQILQSLCNRGHYLSTWICKPLSTLFPSLKFDSPCQQEVGESVIDSGPSSPSMDIIEIGSSDSDDGFEFSDAGVQDSYISEADNRNSEFDSNDRSRYRALPSSFNITDRVQRQPPLAFSENDRPKAPIGLRSIDGFHSSSSIPHVRSSAGVVQIFPPTSSSNGKISSDSSTKASSEMRFNSNYHDQRSYSIGANYSDTPKRSLPPSFLKGRLGKSSRDGGDDNHMYGNAGTYRVQPSLMVPVKLHNSWQPSSASEGQKHSGIGEDRRGGNDERPIFREALQNLGQPNLEEDLPEGLLSVSLLKHQKIALAWMVQKEKSIHCAGGILADDQGLGKTISMIALIQKQMPQQFKFTSDNLNFIKPEALNLDDDDDSVNEGDKLSLQNGENTSKSLPISSTSNFAFQDPVNERDKKNMLNGEKSPTSETLSSTLNRATQNSRPAAGTLVVCPASVLQQWARELDEKVAPGAKLTVLVYHGGSRTKDPSDLAKYDVVLTTYSIVTNEVPKQTAVDDDDDEQKKRDKYGLTSEFSSNKKRKQTSNGQKKSKKKGKGLKDSSFDMGFGPLARVRWFRVILDEAQTIKNHRTQVARACCGLRAKRRWCLSGTPMQNAIDDLYSYFRFLKYDPYAAYSSFCAQIKSPICRNANQGYKKLQAILRAVLLRRTKGTLIDGEPVLNLPPKTICLERVEFSKEERDFYMKLEADSREQFKMYAAAGTVKQNYANILLMLLRLRQACNHPLLVKESNTDTVGKYSLEMARQLPREMLINLVSLLEGSLAICGVCNDPPEDAVVTMCGHVFCYQCISERLTGDDNLCPAPGCSDVLGTDSVFSKSTLRRCVSDDYANEASTSYACEEQSSITQTSYVSSKIRATIDILHSISCSTCESSPKENVEPDCSLVRVHSYTSGVSGPSTSDANHGLVQQKSDSNLPAKAIIFSQWTCMLDLLELSLNHSFIQYRRLDGAMPLMSRDKAVKDFNTDPEVTVMIMSLKAGSLGLNMVAACHVILLDLWWNPTTEDQAIDRAHRIGQTRPVTVSRLTIKDSVEDRILALQEEKRKMVASAFGEQSGSHASRLTVEDLRYLFMVDFDDD